VFPQVGVDQTSLDAFKTALVSQHIAYKQPDGFILFNSGTFILYLNQSCLLHVTKMST